MAARIVGIVCALGLLVSLAGCATRHADVPEWVGRMPRACLPDAIAMTRALRAEGVRARTVVYACADGGGHALSSYLYPPGQNRLWAWDAWWGSAGLRAYANDAEGIARGFEAATYHRHVTRAEFADHPNDFQP
jgi:hypothetical protein